MSRVLVHLRLTVPGDLTDAVCDLLCDPDWVTNVTLERDVVRKPDGDLVEADVAREEVHDLLRRLRELGVSDRGGVVVTTPTSTPFAAAERLEAAAPGDPDDAVIWEAVLADAEAGARPTVSFQVFLLLAVLLGAIAVVQDSSILVVGAMVVGPEFAVIAAASAGLVFGRWALVRRSLVLLVASFAIAIGLVTLLSLVARATGLVTLDMVTRPRPQTGFIWHPDAWSLIVAVIAGAAGALALSVAKSNVMVGVFISVTTVPAAGNLALGLAFWTRHEMLGSAAQLGINLVGMVLAGAAMLLFQRLFWTRLSHLTERVSPQRRGRR